MRRTMQYGIPTRRALSNFAAVLIAGSALAGCAAMPPASQLAQPRALDAAPANDAAFPADTWWTAYSDPGLDALIAQGLANSPDMAIAAARIRAADGVARQAGAAALPTLGVDAAVGGNKQSYNMGIPAQFVPHGVVDTGRISGTLGLDLDLWGRNRAALSAASGEGAAARVDGAQARLLLTSAIALAWGDLAQLYATRDVAARQAEVLAETERLTETRRASGIDSGIDLNLARARHAGAQQALAALDEAIAISRNRIAALVGAGPDLSATLPMPRAGLTASTAIPAELPASLVARRPDLAAALLRTEAAAQRVKVARLDFYPDINLSAVVGLQSLGIAQLFDSGSTYANFGPAIRLPLFEGGRLRGRYDSAAAGYEEAVARYDQSLLGALREVADTLESRRDLAGRLASARAADAAAQEAARLVALRRAQGIASQLQVLAAEDTALSARRLVVELEARAYLLDVMLTKALGGGFTAPTRPLGNN